MCQVDVTDTVSAVNETQDIQILASLHESLPWQAYSRKSDHGIEHGNCRISPLLLHSLYGVAEQLYQQGVVNRESHINASAFSWRSFAHILNGFFACPISGAEIQYGIAFNEPQVA